MQAIGSSSTLGALASTGELLPAVKRSCLPAGCKSKHAQRCCLGCVETREDGSAGMPHHRLLHPHAAPLAVAPPCPTTGCCTPMPHHWLLHPHACRVNYAPEMWQSMLDAVKAGTDGMSDIDLSGKQLQLQPPNNAGTGLVYTLARPYCLPPPHALLWAHGAAHGHCLMPASSLAAAGTLNDAWALSDASQLSSTIPTQLSSLITERARPELTAAAVPLW